MKQIYGRYVIVLEAAEPYIKIHVRRDYMKSTSGAIIVVNHLFAQQLTPNATSWFPGGIQVVLRPVFSIKQI